MPTPVIPYEVIKDGTTIGCMIMTPEQQDHQRTLHPKCTYVPLLGVAITSSENE